MLSLPEAYVQADARPGRARPDLNGIAEPPRDREPPTARLPATWDDVARERVVDPRPAIAHLADQ